MIVNGTVEIIGDRIGYVGIASSFTPPVEAQVIDVNGQTIMPGVINSHVHNPEVTNGMGLSGPNLRRAFLIDGVTSTCFTGHSIETMSDFDIELTENVVPAGRVFNSGPPITSTGGLLSVHLAREIRYPVSGEAEAEAAVEDLISQGADFILISFETDPDTPATGPRLLNVLELRAIAAATHSRGMKLRAIVSDSEQLDLALSAGIDVIDKMPAFRNVPTSQAESLNSIFEDQVTFEVNEMKADIQKLAVNTAIVITPTLSVINVRDPWTRTRNGSEISIYNEILARFQNQGGRIAVGSGYPLGPNIGMPLTEMNALASAGLTNQQILTAATYNAALACGQGDEIGSLEEGKLADVIVVNGDPLSNLSALSDVDTVILNGEIVFS